MPAHEAPIGDGRAVLQVSSDSERVLVETPFGALRLTREEAWRLAEAIDIAKAHHSEGLRYVRDVEGKPSSAAHRREVKRSGDPIMASFPLGGGYENSSFTFGSIQ